MKEQNSLTQKMVQKTVTLRVPVTLQKCPVILLTTTFILIWSLNHDELLDGSLKDMHSIMRCCDAIKYKGMQVFNMSASAPQSLLCCVRWHE